MTFIVQIFESIPLSREKTLSTFCLLIVSYCKKQNDKSEKTQMRGKMGPPDLAPLLHQCDITPSSMPGFDCTMLL